MSIPTSITMPIKRVKIVSINTPKRIIICDMGNNETGYIPFEDYSIYFSSAKKMPITKEYIYVISQTYDTKKKMYRLNSRVVQENYYCSLNCGDSVEAHVVKLANDKMAFCDIGYGIKASIRIEELIKYPEAVYSIADLIESGTNFKAKISGRNNKGYFSIITKDISEYENISFSDEGIITGTIGKPITDKSIFNNNKYHYYFIISFQYIGYIESEEPIGYGKTVLGKITDTEKLKFKLQK